MNSEIVKFRAYQKTDCIVDNHLIGLMKVKDLATNVEYAYETAILEDLLVGKSVDDHRLLFL